ncbi:MAG: hypothetical protein U0M15_08155 [Bacillota bacterium]|nr:hypothetical protein [Bacillota bacterium]
MSVIFGPFVDEIVSMMMESDIHSCGASISYGDVIGAGRRWGIFLDMGHVIWYDEERKCLSIVSLSAFSGDCASLSVLEFPKSFDEKGKTTVEKRDGTVYIVSFEEIFPEEISPSQYLCYSKGDTGRRAQSPLALNRQWPNSGAFALWCKAGISEKRAPEILRILEKKFPSGVQKRK